MQLSEIHQSVFVHEKITHLDLTGCISLRSLPYPIQMKYLQVLLLRKCVNLKTLSEVSIEMRKFLVLDIGWCDRIKALPSSFRLLTSLTILKMGVIDVSLVAKKHKQGYSKRILPNNSQVQGSTHFSSLRMILKRITFQKMTSQMMSILHGPPWKS